MTQIRELTDETSEINNIFVYVGYLDTYNGDFNRTRQLPEESTDFYKRWGHKRYLKGFYIMEWGEYDLIFDGCLEDFDEVISLVNRKGYDILYMK